MEKVVFTYNNKGQYNDKVSGCAIVLIVPFLFLLLAFFNVGAFSKASIPLIILIVGTIIYITSAVYNYKGIYDDIEESYGKMEFSYDPDTKTFRFKYEPCDMDVVFTADDIDRWEETDFRGKKYDTFFLKDGQEIVLKDEFNDDIRPYLQAHAEELGIKNKRALLLN